MGFLADALKEERDDLKYQVEDENDRLQELIEAAKVKIRIVLALQCP